MVTYRPTMRRVYYGGWKKSKKILIVGWRSLLVSFVGTLVITVTYSDFTISLINFHSDQIKEFSGRILKMWIDFI